MRQHTRGSPRRRVPRAIYVGLVMVLTQVGAKKSSGNPPPSDVDRSRGLRTMSEYLFLGVRDVGAELRSDQHRALPAHNPTTSYSPSATSLPAPTSGPPVVPSTSRPSARSPRSPPSSSSSKSVPHSYSPTISDSPVSSGKGMSMDGKGMMMGEGKGSGKGGMMMSVKTKAPVPPKISKAPVVMKTKAPEPIKTKPPVPPVSSKTKSKKSKSKSTKNDPKKKDPKKMSPKSSSKANSKSKISKPPSCPHAPPATKSPSTSVPPSAPSTVVPSFAPAPGGSTSVTLTLYQIGYVVSLTAIPSTTEVDGVVNVTQQFLSSLFQTLYPTMAGFETVKVSDKLQLNAPYEIVYNSTVVFQAGSTLPSLEELNSQLQTAFTGETKTEYLSLLANLGPDNIFSQTTDVVFTFYETNADAVSGQSYPTTTTLGPTALTAIGVGTLAVLVTTATLVHYVRHRGEIHGSGNKTPPPPDSADETAAVDDSHEASTAGKHRSYMSPRSISSEGSIDDNTHPVRNYSRTRRISRQTIDPVESSSPDREGTSNFILSRMRMSLSYEGDDEAWVNATSESQDDGNATYHGESHDHGRRTEREAMQSERYPEKEVPTSSMY